MPDLVLIRHGQSQWNLENRFTGWHDVDITETGQAEARAAGDAIKAAGLSFDHAYTSVLKRAIRTLWITLDRLDMMWLPVEKDWRLNERHYGALTGLDKAETAAEHGEEQVHIWRRSFATPPPALEAGDPRTMADDPRYKHLAADVFPRTESLKDTIARVRPYWAEHMAPRLLRGENVLVVAHGNSLRGLRMILESLSEEAIMGVEMPTGAPLHYRLDDDLGLDGAPTFLKS